MAAMSVGPVCKGKRGARPLSVEAAPGSHVSVVMSAPSSRCSGGTGEDGPWAHGIDPVAAEGFVSGGASITGCTELLSGDKAGECSRSPSADGIVSREWGMPFSFGSMEPVFAFGKIKSDTAEFNRRTLPL